MIVKGKREEFNTSGEFKACLPGRGTAFALLVRLLSLIC